MVAESAAQGASLPRGVEACIHTLPESVVSLITWRPRCSEEAAVPLGRPQSKKAAVSTRGRLLLATTNWRFLCRPHFFDFGSVSAVDRKLFRSADAWDRFSFAGSPTGEEGGKIRNNGCAQGAREARRRRRCIAIVRRSATRRRRARETARSRRKHRGGDVRAGQRSGSGSV